MLILEKLGVIIYVQINIFSWQRFYQLDTLSGGITPRFRMSKEFVTHRFVKSAFGCLLNDDRIKIT
jgi:hypothetical protein